MSNRPYSIHRHDSSCSGCGCLTFIGLAMMLIVVAGYFYFHP